MSDDERRIPLPLPSRTSSSVHVQSRFSCYPPIASMEGTRAHTALSAQPRVSLHHAVSQGSSMLSGSHRYASMLNNKLSMEGKANPMHIPTGPKLKVSPTQCPQNATCRVIKGVQEERASSFNQLLLECATFLNVHQLTNG